MDRYARIEAESFLQKLSDFRPDVVVVHPYYGQDLNEQEQALLREAKRRGCFIMVDFTQCIDSKARYDFADVYMGSLRKWFSIPDGGVYHSKTLPLDTAELPEYTKFSEVMQDAMYLSNLYNQTGQWQIRQISKHISKWSGQGEDSNLPAGLHRMSDFSRRILYGFDFDAYARQRLENARYLWKMLKDSEECTPLYKSGSDITTGPMWFPVYVPGDVRQFGQERMKPAGIEMCRMWFTKKPKDNHRMSQQVWDLFFQCAQFPIGLNYGKEEMDYLLKAIRK